MRSKHTLLAVLFTTALFSLGAAAIFVVPQVMESPGPAEAKPTTRKKSSKEPPEHAIVREYLRKNTPTGKWEEVEWYPVIKTSDVYAARLKYRTENPFGGQSVIDEVFALDKDGSVQFTEANGDRRIWWSK